MRLATIIISICAIAPPFEWSIVSIWHRRNGHVQLCSAACVVIDAALKALAFVECIVIFDCRWTVNDQRIWRRSRGGCMRALIDANCYSTVRRCPNNCGIN